MWSAYLILIGNELLSGKVRDINGAYALERLRTSGVDTFGLEVVPDEHERIVEAVQRVRGTLRPTWVITSGGIGPTHDDITLRALAAALERPCVRDAELEARLREYYREHINDDVLAMADVPQGTQLTFAESFFPLIRIENVAALPGEPTFFRAKLDQLLAQLFTQPLPPFVTHKLTLARGESSLAKLLRELDAEFPGVLIGSYPRLDEQAQRWYTLVTLDSRDGEQVHAVHARLVEAVGAETILHADTD